MPGEIADDLLTLFDTAPLNRRYWIAFALLSALFVLEFFDFLVVGYLLAVLGPEWHLTYGQSALILYGGGIGSILGALVFGGLADAWGRKTQMVIGTFICAVAAGAVGLVPAGSWQIFAVLRFFVGVGLTAGVTPALTILVELTPTRSRTLLTSFYIVFASAGGLLASTTSAALLAALGWRGVAMLGVLPAFVGILIWLYVPESVRWLAAKGRFAEARTEVANHLGLPLGAVPLPTAAAVSQPRGALSELYRHPRMFWETILIWGGSSTAGYGVYLWGPTIVALALHVPVPRAAAYFVLVALGGVVGKIVVTFCAPLIGRRALGIVWGVGAVIALAAAGYYHAALVGGLPMMVILLCVSTFFIEGGFANLAPYTVESYGVNLGARASGLGQAANGVGKILGPLSLALIAGSGNLLSPQATAAAVFPAYLFLAFCMALVALSFLLLGVETHGKAMSIAPADARRPTPTILETEAR
jgi:MFS transporter, putative metabolite:H+ symporter